MTISNNLNKSFKAYLQSLNYKPNTIERYTAWEPSFVNYFATEQPGKSLENLSYKDLLNYIEHHQDKGVKRSTLVLLLGRIKHYYLYLGVANPLEDFSLKGKEARQLGQLLTAQQLKAISVVYHQNRRLSLLSKVGVSLLVYQGLSTHELPLLKVEHLNLVAGEIAIPSSHLDGRILTLESSQILSCLELIQSKEPSDSLLGYKSSSHLQNRHTHWKEQIARELSKHQLKIPFKNLQQLRNSRLACWVKEKGLLHTQYLAGHQHLGSTQAYQTEDYEAMRASFEQLHPLY